MKYQEILQDELNRRTKRNPSFSLRAFARILGMSAPHLSGILRGKKGLSTTSAQRVAASLQLNAEDIETFCDLVTLEHSKNLAEVKSARRRLKENKKKNSFQQIGTNEFNLISDWYHMAIMHLLELDEFKSDPNWIAGKLSLPVDTVCQAIQRLEKAQLIDCSKKPWKITKRFMAVGNKSSAALKIFHHQILQKAIRSIDEQNSAERDLSAVVLACDENKIPEAKEWIKKFRREFCTELDKSTKKNRIYCLSIQLFKLSDLKELT